MSEVDIVEEEYRLMNPQPTLTEFLLDRIAYDEAGARSAINIAEPGEALHWATWDDAGRYAACGTDYGPARVLAECEAKRRIVGLEGEAHRLVLSELPTAYMGLVLKFLAVPYADHPDYREEWKP